MHSFTEITSSETRKATTCLWLLPILCSQRFNFLIRCVAKYFHIFVWFTDVFSYLLFLVLKIVDYDSKACVQPGSVKLSIRILITAVPFSLICFSLLILLFYPIDESKRKSNSQKINLVLDGNDSDVTKHADNFTQSYSSIKRVIESSTVFSKI